MEFNEVVHQRQVKAVFYRHWRELSTEKLHLQPLESEIKNEIRAKWLMKISFAALNRYKQIKQGKKTMFENIVQYHNELVIEKAFKKLVSYTDRRIAIAEMQ